MTSICRVPGRVAAATSSFTVGLSASSGIVVFAAQGRLGSDLVAPVLLGSITGGMFGSVIQSRLPPRAMRAVLSVLLVTIGILLLRGVS
ncbi:MAG: hypothetical protein KatS3mg008_0234 [Acidimicrobiales bacterium]|nr:MAG: hypothetical protein KatS3mg008_0234 [Acidimicrobiales bacterium]